MMTITTTRRFCDSFLFFINLFVLNLCIYLSFLLSLKKDETILYFKLEYEKCQNDISFWLEIYTSTRRKYT